MLRKEFILAGRAIFTVENAKGEWKTFRVKVNDEESQKRYGVKHFISMLTGPDNQTAYTYIGIVEEKDGQVIVRLTTGSRYPEGSVPVNTARWILKRIWNQWEMPAGCKLHAENECGRCGRPLTTPASVESGLGPVCRRILGLAVAKDEEGLEEAHEEECEPPATEPEVYEASDIGGVPPGFTPVRDAEGEITHWTGRRNGRQVVVLND